MNLIGSLMTKIDFRSVETHVFFFSFFWDDVKREVIPIFPSFQGPVVRRPISANPVKFEPRFLFLLFKSIFRDNFLDSF